MLLLPGSAYAISAQWDLDPISGDWNTAANWTPMGVPNGPADIATFGLSHTTDVSISERTEVNAIVFAAGASAYTITNANLTQSSGPLFIRGMGIVNNSGTTQTFVAQAGSGLLGGGDILLSDGATAGIFFISSVPDGPFGPNGGAIAIAGHANGGYGTFINKGGTPGNFGYGGQTSIGADGSAGHGTFINEGGEGASFADGGHTDIGGHDHIATAANGTFINNEGLANGARGGSTQLIRNATADHGTFVNNGGTVSGAHGGFTELISVPAANGTFINNGGMASGAGGGVTRFENSSLDSATLIANGGTDGGEGGAIFLIDSVGGTPRVEVFGNGKLDISAISVHRLSIGSLEGDGNVFSGDKDLTVAGNDLSTTFSGVIQNGGLVNGVGASLTKIGSGTLVLSGVNTYTGDTHINHGVLKVDGSINSNTFVQHPGTLGGTGTVDANVINRGTVSPGDPVGALTVSNYTQTQYATLMIQIAGASASEFGVLNVLGTANLSSQLDPVLLNGFVPTIGETFTFLHYGAVTGTLFIFNRNIDNQPEHWVISYGPTAAILTVAPGNVSVPDQGSTFLLLTLGLLALVAYRQKCWRQWPYHRQPKGNAEAIFRARS